MCTQKMRALSYIGDEKITFPPKPDRQTYRQTYRHTYKRTDISVYRVASLLKRVKDCIRAYGDNCILLVISFSTYF